MTPSDALSAAARWAALAARPGMGLSHLASRPTARATATSPSPVVWPGSAVARCTAGPAHLLSDTAGRRADAVASALTPATAPDAARHVTGPEVAS